MGEYGIMKDETRARKAQLSDQYCGSNKQTRYESRPDAMAEYFISSIDRVTEAMTTREFNETKCKPDEPPRVDTGVKETTAAQPQRSEHVSELLGPVDFRPPNPERYPGYGEDVRADPKSKPQRSDQQEWTPEWLANYGSAENWLEEICKAHKAALAAERQRREQADKEATQWFSEARANNDNYERAVASGNRYRQRLLSALAAIEPLVEALERLRDCDFVITLPDRMDAVRKIARDALAKVKEGK